jgi:hypothetical protein
MSVQPKTSLPTGENASFPERLSDEQIGRLAEMIADGRADLPTELTHTDAIRLQRAIRYCLRARLMRLISRAIAHHLQLPEKDNHHARPQI